jgi:hypothetical protein
MLLFSLSILETVDISSSMRFHNDLNHEFGFVEGATANITVSNAPGFFIVGLFESKALVAFQRSPFDHAPYCALNLTVSDLQVPTNETAFTFSVEIPKRTSYIPFFLGCDCEGYELHVTYYFYNVDGHLDYHMDFARISSPIVIGLFGLCLTLWIVNWVMYFTLDYPLHFFITATSTLFTISKSLEYAALQEEDADGFVSRPLALSHGIANAVAKSVMFFTILATGYGWFIVRAELRVCEMIPGCVGILLFSICKGMLDYRDDWDDRADVMLTLAAIAGLLTFVHAVSRAIKTTSLSVTMHFEAIHAGGVDPKSIPVYAKFGEVIAYYKGLTLYAVSLVCAVIFDMFMSLLLWFSSIIYALMDLFVCAGLSWLMRLQPGSLSNYLILGADTAITIVPIEPSVDNIEPDEQEPQKSDPGESIEETLPDNPYDDTVL